LINAEVIHGKFGNGTIVAIDETVVTVKFAEAVGEKRFLYPSAFSMFLKFADLDKQEAINAELAAIKSAKEAASAKLDLEAAQKRAKELVASAPKKKPAAKGTPKSAAKPKAAKAAPKAAAKE